MFKNKRVVITGGSEGIGFACSEYFLKREAAVLITAARIITGQRRFINIARISDSLWRRMAAFELYVY